MLVCVWLVSSLIHMISGCSLSTPTEVTGYTGGSVVLPCYCTEGQPIPNNHRWFFQHGSSFIELWPNLNTGNDHYKDRVIVSKTPGNLSLSLSDLTLFDTRRYWCEADGQHRDISLTVKGCSLSLSTQVTGYTGGSVVLLCYCTEGQPTPNSARWVFSSPRSEITLWPYPNTVNDRFKDRVFISDTPGNLSLRLSDLTLSDEGTYSCEADEKHINIILTVKGCVLSDSEPIQITGFTGDSVVLPCACTDRKPESVKWTAVKGQQSTVICPQFPANGGRCKDRVQVLDSNSPGNLSLRLSDLTLLDGGTYRCEADGQHRVIRLTVKGCVLSDSKPIVITGFTGDSVVLPCACTDRKPESVKWTAVKGQQSTVICPQLPANGGRCKDRVQVLDSISPGNLSLRLSDLTLLDGGTYKCEADGHYRDISLTVIHRFDELCLKV